MLHPKDSGVIISLGGSECYISKTNLVFPYPNIS